MQVGGIGGGHSDHSHHVTDFHHHHASDKLEPRDTVPWRAGGGGSQAASSRQGSFSLSDWLADPLKSMKKVLGGLWNGREHGSAQGTESRPAEGREQVLANLAEDLKGNALESAAGDIAGRQPGGQTAVAETAVSAPGTPPHTPQIAAAATALRPQDPPLNPYFSAMDSVDRQQRTLWQKAKASLQTATGFLMKKFSFSGKDSFQAKQEKPREDLRKRSRYHGDDLDMECVLTDDSYLLDSYDRSGQYSQLSAKK